MRAVVGRPTTLRYHLTDDVGANLTPDNGTHVTVTVLSGDGVTVLYAAQQASLNAQDGGTWEWVMPPQSQLDSLTATWSATVGGLVYTEAQNIDVVSCRLVEPYQFQGDPDLMNLITAGPGPLLLLIDQIEDGLREILGFPPTLEGFRVTWDQLRGTLNDALYVSGTVNGLPYGWGAGKMWIPGVKFPAQIYSGTINGVALDPVNDIPKLLIQNGTLIWSDYRPWISGRYAFYGTHGEPNPPRDLRQVAKKLVHHVGQSVDYPDRAYQVVTEGATILFSMPSPDRPTGIPEVDVILARYRLASVI